MTHKIAAEPCKKKGEKKLDLLRKDRVTKFKSQELEEQISQVMWKVCGCCTLILWSS